VLLALESLAQIAANKLLGELTPIPWLQKPLYGLIFLLKKEDYRHKKDLKQPFSLAIYSI